MGTAKRPTRRIGWGALSGRPCRTRTDNQRIKSRKVCVQLEESQSRSRLPGAGTRTLHPGASSWILKGVVEKFAASLVEPNVLFISQPGEKVNLLDGKALKDMGLEVDQATLLPDCLMADLAPSRDEFWFIEVVASDGPVTEERRQALIDWATAHGLEAEKCRFLTAFESRTASEAKKSLPVLAHGSYAWFANEPDGLLSWDELRFA
ncbi:BsuBI/PstI family type II restriction endonuclease [Streptomyces sp. NPDC048257]|uniref:BsuBI/PstI family type II restriction endonuclease n=1 Tax=Streptomyces sp. NPDC048257 TaxID=3365526 RepID=UPI00371FB856